MGTYIGIDLGTTNSAICSYDGVRTTVYKSPEQNDVTPSAVYVDRRGRRYYGRRAYEMAPMDEKNAATLFKRYMGTNKTFTFAATGETLTPQALSAEILRVLFGYLPEQARNAEGTVITVPAAFNQMKKDATLEAARMAGLGRVALIQEPVAAVMSVMKQDNSEKVFLVYDLGGGTFDITVARSLSGRVSLLAQGGKEMCGGRDWDRLLFGRIVEPWLRENFRLSQDVSNAVVRKVTRLALLAIEQAKIELSSCEETSVRMDEVQLNAQDLDGEEIYLDVPLTRSALNGIIADTIDDTVEVVRDTLQRSGIRAQDVEQIVFVGGPTCYEPLREKVMKALGVPSGVFVNPMTAVAEGAAIYAESIDWESEQRGRKAAHGERRALDTLKIRYDSRTAGDKGRIAFTAQEDGLSVEAVSLDTGWTSGRAQVNEKLLLEVPLMMRGENTFRIAVYDADGMPVAIEDNRIVITRTLTTVSAIPASYPVAVKALDRIGGHPVPVYLIEENDLLPKRGKVSFRAGCSLAAGSAGALVFTLWEGSIREPIEDNRYIGVYRIPGTCFMQGVIPSGAEIICEYEMNESGTLHLGVSIPCVGVNLSAQNFYSRVDGQTDLQDASRLIREANEVLMSTQEMKRSVQDTEIDRIRRIAMDAKAAAGGVPDGEALQAAYGDLLECRRKMAKMRQKYRALLRRRDLEGRISEFESDKHSATAYEITAFENLKEEALYAIERDLADFDTYLDEMDGYIATARWRQDDFIRRCFMSYAGRPEEFSDRVAFDRLRAKGIAHLEKGRMDELRSVFSEMLEYRIMRENVKSDHMYDDVNIVRS
ncbi:MAG: Hsp70 family protein [Clostridia bacterium]|nr:Hsp70 family protein [Clostridia bacterium]